MKIETVEDAVKFMRSKDNQHEVNKMIILTNWGKIQDIAQERIEEKWDKFHSSAWNEVLDPTLLESDIDVAIADFMVYTSIYNSVNKNL